MCSCLESIVFQNHAFVLDSIDQNKYNLYIINMEAIQQTMSKDWVLEELLFDLQHPQVLLNYEEVQAED